MTTWIDLCSLFPECDVALFDDFTGWSVVVYFDFITEPTTDTIRGVCFTGSKICLDVTFRDGLNSFTTYTAPSVGVNSPAAADTVTEISADFFGVAGSFFTDNYGDLTTGIVLYRYLKDGEVPYYKIGDKETVWTTSGQASTD